MSDDKESIINQTQMIKQIKKELDKELGENSYPESWVVAEHNWVNKWNMSKYIQESRQKQYSSRSSGDSHSGTDNLVDYPVSEKQKKYIIDLKGNPDTPKTWKEASKYIDDLKNK